MNLVRRYNTLLCFTAFLAAIAYCAADDGTLLLALLTIIACASAWRTSRAQRPWTLPRWLINLLMLAAIIDATLKVLSSRSTAGFWTGAASTPIVSTLSQFLVYILLAKLFDRRTIRDEAHLLSLSIFVIVGAVLTSNSLVVGLLVLTFAPCVICTSMLLQIVGGARAVHNWDAADRPPDQPPPDILAASHRRFRRDFSGVAVIAVFGTLAFATLSFVLMPRGLFKDSLGGFGKVQSGSVVGFTDQIRLGSSGILKNSSDHTPILNVRLTDVDGRELGELRGTLYMRGVVKDRYQHHNFLWTADDPAARTSGRDGGERSADPPPPSSARGTSVPVGGARAFETGPDQPLHLGQTGRAQIVVRQHVTLRRPIRAPGYFFTMWRPIEFNTESRSLVQPPAPDMVLRTYVNSALKSYTVSSALEYTDDVEPEGTPPTFNSPTIRAIAEEILNQRDIPLDPHERDATLNRRTALAFVDYLRANCVYTTEMIAPEADEDPIEMFLTRTRSGHCEYFASAMVALCQSVGLHARLVGGYLASEFNRVTGEYVIRESNAHAWSEVRMSRGRWQTFDPSPPDAIDAIHKPPVGLLARVRQWYEAINFTWGTAVVSFDGRTQRELVGSPEGWRGVFGQVGGFLTSVRRQFAGAAGVVRLVVMAIFGLALIVVLRRAWRANRRRRRSRPDKPTAPADPALNRLLEQVTFYADALSILKRADLEKPTHLPPVLHAQTIKRDDPSIAGAFDTLANLYYRVRFGRRPLTSDELNSASTLLASIEQRLHQRDGAQNGAPTHPPASAHP